MICHNDAALYNIVFKDQDPIAFIDFDLAVPGPRIWDIVYMLYTSVPLSSFQARIEDITMNLLGAGEEQVFKTGN